MSSGLSRNSVRACGESLPSLLGEAVTAPIFLNQSFRRKLVQGLLQSVLQSPAKVCPRKPNCLRQLLGATSRNCGGRAGATLQSERPPYLQTLGPRGEQLVRSIDDYARSVPTAPVAATSLVAGYGVAAATRMRPIGGLVDAERCPEPVPEFPHPATTTAQPGTTTSTARICTRI